MSVPKYCRECGSAIEKRVYVVGYDERTGQEKSAERAACPNYGAREFDPHYPDYGGDDDLGCVLVAILGLGLGLILWLAGAQ